MTGDEVRGSRMPAAWLRGHAGMSAWALAGLALALGLLLFGVLVAWSDTPGIGPGETWQAVPVLLFFMASPVVGALIVSRARGNPIGWLFIVISGALAFGFLANAYATHELARGEDLSRATLVRWLGSWLSVPAFALLPLFALLFPDGRPPTRRWRPVLWTTVAGGFALALSQALRPEMIVRPAGSAQVLGPNPVGITAWAPVHAALEALGIALIVGSLLLGTVALVVRFRRSRGIERQQLKWFVFAMGALAAVLVGATLVALVSSVPAMSGARAASSAAWGLAFSSLMFLPLAAGIAILRYRLYDIDVLINRALVYGALTATLGAAYVASVVVLQALLRPFTAGSDIAVAVSTLAVVALFQPLRRRIQDAVDRRFYRARYDAQRTLDDFTSRLRDEIDLAELERELVSVLASTVRPAHASVWLRGRTG